MKEEFIYHRQDESSQYGGKPLIKPKQPYKYQYEYKLGKVDSDTSYAQKSAIVADDIVDYAKDIIFLRDNAFMFKTAAFTKRNWRRMTSILSKINNGFWYGVHHTLHGLKMLFSEGAWAVSTH